MNIRDFDAYEPPAIGTRFDSGTTCIEYAGECYFDYVPPNEEDESDFQLLNSATDEPLEFLLSEFECVSSHSVLNGDYDGIWHGTINSGYLMRLTRDGEGAFLFRHWGA